jgi:hypothetical protein
MPAKGIKKQVLGGVLFCVGAATVLLSRIIGFELDVFYVVMSFFGVCLFWYGATQKKQNALTGEPKHFCGCCTESALAKDVQSNRIDVAVCANSGSQTAPIRQRASVHNG